jgi:hypothetical protein
VGRFGIFSFGIPSNIPICINWKHRFVVGIIKYSGEFRWGKTACGGSAANLSRGRHRPALRISQGRTSHHAALSAYRSRGELGAGFILPVRKKPEVGEKHVYQISRKFFGFVVFLSDKNLEKKSSIYTQNNLHCFQTI